MMIETDKVREITRGVSDFLRRTANTAKQTREQVKEFDKSVSNQFQDFEDDVIPKLNTKVQRVEALLKAPLYVAFLGRYSHGKTSLVNSLFELSGNDLLPTGKGVVSSRVMRVEFDDTKETQERTRINANGDEEPLEISGSWDGLANDTQSSDLTRGYGLILPGRNSELAQQFTLNRISILDLPGLGGPYFKQNGLIKEYLKLSDLIAVIIKATGIDEAAAVLNREFDNPVFENTPKLVVISFWDEAGKSAVYAGCKTEDEREELCRTKVKEAMPCLSNSLGDMVYTSALEDKHGVNELRDVINQRVSGQNLIIPTAKHESPVIKRNRDINCRKELRDLSLQIDKEIKEFEKLITSSSRTSEQNTDLQKMELRLDRTVRYGRDRFKKEAQRLSRQAISSFNTEANQLRDAKDDKDLQSRITDLVESVNKSILQGFLEDLRDKYEYSIYVPLRDEAIELVHELQLQNARETAKHVEGINKEMSTENMIEFEKLLYSKPNDSLDKYIKALKNISLTFADAVSNPSTVITIVGAVTSVALSKADLPIIGSNLGFLLYIGILLFVYAGYSLYRTWNEVKRRGFIDTLRSLITSLQDDFANVTMKQCDYMKAVDENIEDMKKRVFEKISDVVDPIDSTKRIAKEALEKMYSDAQITIRELENAAKAV